MSRLGVIGAGAMGTGIAQIAATHGWEVQLVDTDIDVARTSLQKLQKILNRQVEKGRMTDQEVVAIMGRIYPSTDLSVMAAADLVIEAIVENLNIKKRVFQDVERIINDDCILASNTSSLSITEIASSLQRPDRLLGIHFFNPAPLMKLVEIIPALQTSSEIAAMATKIIQNWGKYTVEAKDTPGFIVNKVARPFYSESLRIYEENLATAAEIDHIMTVMGGFRMGPFALMDYIGHDVNYKVTETVWQSFYYDGRYRPAFSQKALVQAGYLGRKTGQGFYKYPLPDISAPFTLSEPASKVILHRILAMLINEAADTVYLGICSEQDVEIAMTKGVNYPQGLLGWGADIGYQKIVDTLDGLYHYYHEDRYRVSPYLRKKL